MLKSLRSGLLLFLVSLPAISAEFKNITPESPLVETFSLGSGEVRVFHLSLFQGQYLKGNLTGDHTFKASIHDESGQLIRQLSRPDNREARLFFLAETEGRYQFRIVGEAQQTAFSLQLGSVPLKSETDTPRPEILSETIAKAYKALQQGREADVVWQQLTQGGTPLIESLDGKESKQRVTFLWRGAKERVLILGAPGYQHDPLYRLGETDIWFRSYDLPSDTRLSYQLAPDVPQVAAGGRQQRVAILASAQQDPMNPHQWAPEGATDRFAVKSILELDQAPSDLSLKGDQVIEAATSYQLGSPRLGNTRAVDIWVPEQLKAIPLDRDVPLAIFFDGKAYQSKVPTPKILHNLISNGKIPPLVAVFIDNPSNKSRVKELPCNPDFADFMAQELLPFVTQKTGRRFRGDQTLLAGSSFGGLASTCTAFRYPELFGKVLSLSGSYWWSPATSDRPEWLASQFAETKTKPIRFYLSAGHFETNYGESGILSSNRHLVQILRLKGYPVKLEEFSSGHDYFHWRATLDRGLIHLLGANSSVTVED